MTPSHIVKMLQIWSRASVQTTHTKLQVHLQRDAYLFHHCSLSAPLCHSDHINSSCLLKQGSDKFQKLKTNCGETVINTIKYRNTRITEETELCVFTESTQWKLTVAHRCDTNHQTGLHKPLTTPWTSSQPPLCSPGFYLGATSGPAFCTCTAEVKGAVAVKTMKKYRCNRAKHDLNFLTRFQSEMWRYVSAKASKHAAKRSVTCHVIHAHVRGETITLLTPNSHKGSFSSQVVQMWRSSAAFTC